jgi:zinc/manganese transport system permease protein
LAVALALAGSLAGLALSVQYELGSGPAIVLCLGLLYLVSLLVAPLGAVRSARVPTRHLAG